MENPMTDEEMRLRLLELAVQSGAGPHAAVDVARRFQKFVSAPFGLRPVLVADEPDLELPSTGSVNFPEAARG